MLPQSLRIFCCKCAGSEGCGKAGGRVGNEFGVGALVWLTVTEVGGT